MSTLPPPYQSSYTYPQSTYPLRTQKQNQALIAPTPISPVFNKNPLQPIPYKEALILLAGMGAIYGVYKGHRNLVSGKDKIGHAKALLYSPLAALIGMCRFSSICPIIGVWNLLIDRKRRKTLGLPTPWPTISDAKKEFQSSWAGIKSLVSSSATSQ